MNKQNTIDELLNIWGQSQKQTPPHNEALKAQILDSLMVKPAAKISATPKFNFTWLSLALAGFAVITFLVIPTIKKTETLHQTSTDYTSSGLQALDSGSVANKSGGAQSAPMRSDLSAGSN